MRAEVDAERKIIGPLPSVEDFLEEVSAPGPVVVAPSLNTLNPITNDPDFQQWAQDSVIRHRIEGLRGVHVRTKLGDITSDKARALADVGLKLQAGMPAEIFMRTDARTAFDYLAAPVTAYLRRGMREPL